MSSFLDSSTYGLAGKVLGRLQLQAWDSLVKGKCRCILREMLHRCLPMKLDGLEAVHGKLQDGCWLGEVYLHLVGILYGVKYYKY